MLYLIENNERIGGFDAGVAWNTPALNSYNYVPCDAPEETGSRITLWPSNNDSSYFEFYKGTNVVGYFIGGENEGSYYMADGDLSLIDGDGRTLYDVMRTWYDEAEFVTLRNEVEETPIPNRGQSWEGAAKEYLDAYEGAYAYGRCCTITLEEDGWHGKVWGTGW